MFLQNKYADCYYRIVERARLYHRIKSKETYFESHHIIPTSLGGDNSKENKVLLTAKEHFICHLLLTKMVESDNKRRMSYALQRLYYSRNKKHGCRTYSLVKAIHSKNVSEMMKNHVRTPEHARALSKALKGKKRSKEFKQKITKVRTGWIFSEETKAKIAQRNVGKKAYNNGARNIWVNAGCSVPRGFTLGWIR